MPAAVDASKNEDNRSISSYRPPESFLNVFWTLSDGENEEIRNSGALKLSKLLHSVEEKEFPVVLGYCRDRLIRGLSSGRKFARVGFSVALTQLLREHEGLSNADVMQAIKDKLKIQGEKTSKSEAGGIYLGRAFAFSSLIQSGRIAQLSNDAIRTMVEELLTFGQKKSYMKPICFSVIENLVRQVSVDTFGDSVWSRIRDPIKEGWQNCTLDKLSLLLECRERFPDVVNKKFLKKHWGFPILSEENDEHLFKVILGTETQKTEMLLNKIVPCLRQLDRDLSSVWKAVGEPLMNKESVKKEETLRQRQLVGLKFAYALLSSTSNKDQVLELLLSTSLASAIFHSYTSKKDPLGIEGNALFELVHLKVKEEGLKVQNLVVRLWSLAEEQSEANSGARDITTSNNFSRLIDLMDKEETAAFAKTLIATVNGESDLIKLSSNKAARKRQIESCLRCLHHIVCNQKVTSLDLQKSVLTLFVRLGFFHINKKNGDVPHCNTTMNLEEGQSNQDLCKVLFFKILDQLSTMTAGSQKKSKLMDDYVSLLFEVANYFQVLLKKKNISLMESLPQQIIQKWDEVFTVMSKIHETSIDSRSSKDSAFLLLFIFLSFHMLNDFKISSELLEEVHLCYKKADKPIQKTDSEEPAWQEVLTEVVLNLMSLQNHLARIVSSTVLASIVPHLTVPAVGLITEVLIPKSGRDDDAGGVMVESKDDEEESDDDDDDSLIDEDIADEGSESDSDDGESDSDDEEESEEDQNEEMEIDEKFRASVQEALGAAAIKENGVDEEADEELSDLSDSEMFKLDDMLGEVFRQKEKAKKNKKNIEERKKELSIFRIRVLDLMAVLVKSDRCGDFVLDLLQPLLLVMKNDSKENEEMICKSRNILKQLKTKAQSLVDNLHTSDEQKVFVTDLLELIPNIADGSKLQDVALACHIAMKLSYDKEKESGHKCNELLETSLLQMITGKTKPHPSFFLNLIEHNIERYQFMCPMLVSCLKNTTIKLHGKMICCSMLSSLLKKSQKKSESEETTNLMQEVASILSGLIASLEAGDIKAMFTRELLKLALTLQNRNDIFTQLPFGQAEFQKLNEIKSKLNTDSRKLAKKLSAAIQGKVSKKQPAKTESDKVQAGTKKTKKKRRQSDVNDEAPSSKKAKH